MTRLPLMAKVVARLAEMKVLPLPGFIEVSITT